MNDRVSNKLRDGVLVKTDLGENFGTLFAQPWRKPLWFGLTFTPS